MTVKQVVGAGQIKAILASGDTKPSTTYANGAPVLPGDAIWVYDTDTVYITRDTGTNWVAHGSWTSISAIKTETDQIGTIVNTGGTATLGTILGDAANVPLNTKLGTMTNSGGTAALGSILGDVANSSIAIRLTNIMNQAYQSPPAVAHCTSITTQNLFTIANGVAYIHFIAGYVTTAIQASGNNTKLQFTPTGGSATDLCSILDLTGTVIRTFLYITGVKATALTKSTDPGIIVGTTPFLNPLVLSPGVLSMNCVGTTTEVIDWYVSWSPMVAGTTLS